MKTVLDEARMWELHSVLYQDELRLILAEMFVGEADATRTDPNPAVQEFLRDSRPIETREDSRLMSVRFPQSVSWQVVDESFTKWDDYEERDDTSVLQILRAFFVRRRSKL